MIDLLQRPDMAIGLRVAALYVQASGIYSTIPGIDPWPESRDARLYSGPLPVVAHPPCQRWTTLGALNYRRIGGEHNRPGNDNGCFAAALAAVRRWGGVLEHPARSHAWVTFGLHAPQQGMWTRSGTGWTCEVWQSAYGHRASKATWLYYHGNGFPRIHPLFDRKPGTHRIGGGTPKNRVRRLLRMSQQEADATPPEFARLLIALAASSRAEALA